MKFGLTSIALLLAVSLGQAANFTISSGVTNTTAQTLNANAESGVVQANGTLSVNGTISVTIAAGGTNSTLTNNGTISQLGSVRTIRVQANNVTVTNNGNIINSGTGRTIDVNSGLTNVFVINSTTGVIQSAVEDTIRIEGAGTLQLTNLGSILALAGNVVTSGSRAAGQALDLTNGIGGNITNGSSTNSSALIRAEGHDAVRLGSNMTLTNWGTILGNSTINAASTNNALVGGDAGTYNSTSEGVSFENGSNSTLINYGIISGSRHGVESDTNARNITITNQATGQIIGRNGSGIGFDAVNGTQSVVTINNFGLIRGDYAGVGNIIDRAGLASPDGDGDGIDIDGVATIINNVTGSILSTGAGGWDSAGRANNSEAISIGGGNITNYGLIRGANRGILVNNDGVASRSGNAATTIINHAGATIEGQNGYAIRLENKLGDARDNDTIINYGTIKGTGSIPTPTDTVLLINNTTDTNSTGTLDGVTYTGTGSARFIRGDGSAIQMGEGNDTLSNWGTIIGTNGRAINLEGGDDTLNINAGSKITGLVNGGAHNTGDTLNFNIFGMTTEAAEQLKAGQTVYILGTPYVGFEIINFDASKTIEKVLTTPTARNVFTALSSEQNLSDSARAALQTAAATESTQVFESFTPIIINENAAKLSTNLVTQTGSLVSNRLSNVRSGGPQFDTSGLRVWDSTIERSMQQVGSLLAGTSMVSDSPKNFAQPVEIPDPKRWGFFMSGSAVVAEQGATSQLDKSDYTTFAFLLGSDYRFTENFTGGLFAGYSRTDATLDTFGSKTDVDTGLIGIYGTYTLGNWFLNGTFTYGRNFYDNRRVERATGTTSTSSPEGDQFSIGNTLGHEFKVGQWRLIPEVGTLFTKTIVESYTESGGALPLNVQEDEADSFRTSLGGRVNYQWQTAWGALVPEFRAAWLHEYLASSRTVRATVVGGTNAFNSSTANPDRDFASLGTGITSRFQEAWSISLDYDVEVGREDFYAHQVTGGVRFNF